LDGDGLQQGNFYNDVSPSFTDHTHTHATLYSTPNFPLSHTNTNHRTPKTIWRIPQSQDSSRRAGDFTSRCHQLSRRSTPGTAVERT
jgi:hypothetical protein